MIVHNVSMDYFYTDKELDLIWEHSIRPNAKLQMIFFYIPLGKIVEYAKLASGLRIYGIHKRTFDGDDDDRYFPAYLGLMSPALNFDYRFSKYFQTNFLKNNCLDVGIVHYKPLNSTLKQCVCQGDKVSGMPKIIMKTRNNLFNFDPKDYFLFPTAILTTKATSAWFGLEWINPDGKINPE